MMKTGLVTGLVNVFKCWIINLGIGMRHWHQRVIMTMKNIKGNVYAIHKMYDVTLSIINLCDLMP